MDKDVITLSNTHTPTLSNAPSPPPSIHPPTHQLPLQTPNHAIIGSHTAISITSSVHITQKGKDKKPLQSITAHRTALSSHHWHLGERLAEGGMKGGAGRHFLSNPSSGQVLYCGHLLILCWYTGQLAAESNHSRRLDRTMAVIIVRNNMKGLTVSSINPGM